ncbi:MAG: hypothetical protein HYV07_21370, partial [Deltaproteobacteria bacterium]|nr:hypothetical protein [Deltaproteobacteria bacterium]
MSPPAKLTALALLLAACGLSSEDSARLAPPEGAHASASLSQSPLSCPSGEAGLAAFAASCPELSPGGPQTTCNGEFSVELVSATSSASHATYLHRVCKLGTSPATKDLSHFDVQLSHLAAC